MISTSALLGGCSNHQTGSPGSSLSSPAQADAAALASWNDSPAKRSITAFVSRVTNPDSPDFVPPPERIAVFDNDGTLWADRRRVLLEPPRIRHRIHRSEPPLQRASEPPAQAYKAAAAASIRPREGTRRQFAGTRCMNETFWVIAAPPNLPSGRSGGLATAFGLISLHVNPFLSASELTVMADEINIPPDRLLEAADCVLEGLAELGPTRHAAMPSSLLGSADQPKAFCELTKEEVMAAERFLLRCGLLTAPSAPPPRKLY